jgi:hypothetical protein
MLGPEGFGLRERGVRQVAQRQGSELGVDLLLLVIHETKTYLTGFLTHVPPFPPAALCRIPNGMKPGVHFVLAW